MSRELTTAVLLLFACAGAAHAQDGRVTLRYAGLPATAKYVSADTTGRSMGGATGLNTDAMLATTVELAIMPMGDSLHVTTRLTDMQGSMSAMGQSMNLPRQPGWDAPAEFMLAADGSARLVKSASAAAVGASTSELEAYARMFPRLPGRAVSTGESWTDSASQNIDEAGMRATTRVRTTGTWTGDSTVNGAKVHVLRYVADHDIRVAGTSGGSDISQQLAGSITTIALWDPARKLMVEVHETGELRGTVSAPARGMVDAELVQRLARHIRLQ